MALPTLTPNATTSAIVLPKSVSLGETTTAHIKEACAIGAYTASVGFLTGAATQVAYTYKKLGGDILDLEITSGSVYANYEEACLEYSYLMNIHQSKNALGAALGNTTGSFDHTGQFSGSASGSASNHNANLKFPKMKFP